MYQTNYRTLNKSKILAAIIVTLLLIAVIVTGALISVTTDNKHLSAEAASSSIIDCAAVDENFVLRIRYKNDDGSFVYNFYNYDKVQIRYIESSNGLGFFASWFSPSEKDSGQLVVTLKDRIPYAGVDQNLTIYPYLQGNYIVYDLYPFMLHYIGGRLDPTSPLYNSGTQSRKADSFRVVMYDYGDNPHVEYSNSVNTLYKAPFDLTAPVREGHTFNGWYFDEAFTQPYDDSRVFVDDVLYPKFTINSYAVSYYIDGVRVYNGTLDYGTELTAPTVTGYDFAGWYRDAAFTVSHNGIVKSDVILYAKYTPVPHSVVIYGYENIILKQETRGYNSSYNLAAFTAPNVTGYTFGGWYLDSGFSTSVGNVLLVQSDISVYAKYTINMYSVIIYGLNGQTYMSELMPHGTIVNTSEGPEIEGYTFVGFYEDQAFTIPFINTVITSNTAVFCKFTPIYFNYRIYGYNGVQLQSGLIRYGLDIDPDYMVAPEIPNRTFLGWFSNPEFTTPYVIGTSVQANTDVYAKYSSISYVLSVYSPEGVIYSTTFPDSMVVSSGILIAPTIEGLTFSGWYSDSLYQHAFAAGSTIVADTVLYAKYTGVSYDIPVYGFNAVLLETVTVSHGALVNISEIGVPAVNGYSFADWYTDPQFRTVFDPGLGISYSASLYAKYTRDMYTVRAYAAIDAEEPFFTREYGSYAQLAERTLNLAARTGYTFNGWYSDVELTQAITFPKTLTGNLSVYPKWVINTYSYNVYGYNGELLHTGSLNHGSSIPSAYFVAPFVEGYEFVGWFRDTAMTVSYSSNAIMTAPVNVYAKYTRKTFLVTVYGFNDVINYSGMIPYGNTVPSAALYVNPVTGYTFKGYVSSATSVNPVYFVYTADTGIYATTYIYLRYERNTYHYEIFGFGGVSLSTGDVAFGSLIPEVTIPELEGFAFVDWYSDPGFVTAYKFDTAISNNMMIYAKYSADNYTYIFTDSVSGATRKSGSFIYGNTVSVPVALAHLGYTFQGWYFVDSDEVYNPAVKYPYAIAVEGRYVRTPYVCNLNTEFGYSENVTVLHGDTLSVPSAPVVDGYIFEGWYTSENYTDLYDFSVPVTGNVYLYGKYVKQEGVHLSTNTWTLIGGGIALVALLGAGYYVFAKFFKGKKRKSF